MRKIRFILLVHLIFFGELISVDSAKKKTTRVKFINITSNFNPEISSFFDFSVTPDTNGRSFDLTWNLTTEITKKFHLNVEMLTKDSKTNSYKSAFAYDFDFCRVWDGFMSQAIARTWFSNVKRYGNFPLKCPISKGHYYLKRMQAARDSVPPFIPTGIYSTNVNMYLERENFKDKVFDSFFQVEIWFG